MNSQLLFARERNFFKTFARVNPYKGALVNISVNYVETGLLTSLGAVLLLLIYLVCQQVYCLFEKKQHEQLFISQDMRLQKANVLAIHAGPPEEPLPSVTVGTGEKSESLFHLRKHELLTASTQLNLYQPGENEHSNVSVEETAGHRHIWHLEVNRLNEEGLMLLLAGANKQLKSGDYELALKSFDRVLQQDEHHVSALAGMLFLSRKRGDMTQAHEYLQRLRHEIPDYLPDDSQLFLGAAQ